MIIYSIIQKSQLEGADRIDAEYYQPEYLDLLKKLSKNNLVNLLEVAQRVTQGPNPEFVQEGNVCLNGRSIKSLRVNTEDVNFVNKKEFEKLSSFLVKKGDILITLKGLGSIGKIGYVFENTGAIFSRDVGLIRVKKDSEFLFAFLLSKYGAFQVERSTTGGTGQLTLTTNYVKHFKIPNFDEREIFQITNFISDSGTEYRNSLALYRHAEDLLLEELGLKDFRVPEDLSYIVNYSDTEKVNRVDADYFQPKYTELLERLGSKNSKKLGELVSIKKGFEPGSEVYQEEGKLFIRVSSLSKNGIEEKDQKYLPGELYQKLKLDYEPKVSEILLTKDAIPGIAFVVKESIEGIISGGILRLKSKTDIEPEYLALCINSMIGRMQAERDVGGSIIVHWKPEQIKNLLLPVLPKETQERISDLVKKSHEARKKSKGLLEEAKRKVEEMIEKEGGS